LTRFSFILTSRSSYEKQQVSLLLSKLNIILVYTGSWVTLDHGSNQPFTASFITIVIRNFKPRKRRDVQITCAEKCPSGEYSILETAQGLLLLV